MRKGTFLVIALCIASVYWHANYWRMAWWDKWFVVVGACILVIGNNLRRYFHWTGATFWTYLACSAFWAMAWVDAYPGDIVQMVAIGKVSGYALVSLLAIGGALTVLEYKDYKKLEAGFAFLCFANSACIVVQTCAGVIVDGRGGFFGNPSMSGCLIAMTYPYLVMQPREPLRPQGEAAIGMLATLKRALYLFLPWLACALTGSSQPLGAMGVAVVAWMFATPWRGWGEKNFAMKLLLAPAIGCLIISVLLVLAPADGNNGVFDGTGRFPIWKMTLGWWWAHGHVATGQGTGISQVLIPLIQNSTGVGVRFDPAWWLWLHSDWVQMIFENGIVGAVLGVAMYGSALWRARLVPWLFSAIVTSGAVAAFNFPAHFAVHAFVAATGLAYALLNDFPQPTKRS